MLVTAKEAAKRCRRCHKASGPRATRQRKARSVASAGRCPAQRLKATSTSELGSWQIFWYFANPAPKRFAHSTRCLCASISRRSLAPDISSTTDFRVRVSVAHAIIPRSGSSGTTATVRMRSPGTATGAIMPLMDSKSCSMRASKRKSSPPFTRNQCSRSSLPSMISRFGLCFEGMTMICGAKRRIRMWLCGSGCSSPLYCPGISSKSSMDPCHRERASNRFSQLENKSTCSLRPIPCFDWFFDQLSKVAMNFSHKSFLAKPTSLSLKSGVQAMPIFWACR
mmetsp:Transcript_164444/g.299832  ORF Transcript_164444/g.299832 Transcript_164444/m.299832 type:complete len:281 (+) Transcript_164444:314-1156(+)